MKLESKIKTISSYKASEGKLFLKLEFTDDKCTAFDSNLRYNKTIEDWTFYQKALKKILRRIKKDTLSSISNIKRKSKEKMKKG